MTIEPTRPLPPSQFADDDGSPSPGLQAALAAFDGGEGGSADVLAALASGRLLVPVVAVPSGEGAAGHDDAGHDADDGGGEDSRVATVLTIGRDGRRGLLAFTSVETIKRWNPDARPVPVSTRRAAEATLTEGADALVIDLAGPVKFSVDVADLRSLISGWRPVDLWHGVDEAEKTGRPTAEPRAAARRGRLRAVGRRILARLRRLV